MLSLTAKKKIQGWGYVVNIFIGIEKCTYCEYFYYDYAKKFNGVRILFGGVFRGAKPS